MRLLSNSDLRPSAGRSRNHLLPSVSQWWLGAAIFLLAACNQTSEPLTQADKEWRYYGGNARGNRYSKLDQINTENVRNLEVAWTYRTGDNPDSNRTDMQSQPIMVNGILYTTSPKLKMLALNAATGEPVWTFDPAKAGESRLSVSRGVVYWEEGDDKRILFTAGRTLYALNALTGEQIRSFGNNGEVNLLEGLDRDATGLYFAGTTPGVVYKNLLIQGGRVSENADAAPGHIRAYDIRTGERKWIFHTIPLPGQYGYETWPKDAHKTVGGANVWSGMAVDEARGIVYAPTGSPSYDFYGGNRHGENLFGNSLIALNAETGERIWHYQTVRHDLWDRDLPAQPNLITVTHNGKKVDAVAQATKSGFVFLFNRETGEPLFPIEEQPAPPTDLAGEQAWPTQPIPTRPAPFARQLFTEADVTDISPESQAEVLERFRKTRTGQRFIPPSKEGTIIFPGFDGGAEWGGNAVDPNGIMYVNSNEMPWILTMVEVDPGKLKGKHAEGQNLYVVNCASCHGVDRMGDQHNFPSLVGVESRLSRPQIEQLLKGGRGRMPSFEHISSDKRAKIIDYLTGSEPATPVRSVSEARAEATAPFEIPEFPYVSTGYHRFLDKDGYPAVKPPWGTLNAIDLNTGEHLWQVPLGEFEELTKKGIPQTGTENYGGPVVTAGGVLFIGATKDEKFRAFDVKTGKVLWETKLPAGGYATPATYEVNGKQYVVISAGGNKMGTKPGDYIIAFSLPD